MEPLAIISHNSFRAIGLHKSMSPSSPYGPAPQGSQLITLHSLTHKLWNIHTAESPCGAVRGH